MGRRKIAWREVRIRLDKRWPAMRESRGFSQAADGGNCGEQRRGEERRAVDELFLVCEFLSEMIDGRRWRRRWTMMVMMTVRLASYFVQLREFSGSPGGVRLAPPRLTAGLHHAMLQIQSRRLLLSSGHVYLASRRVHRQPRGPAQVSLMPWCKYVCSP